jgi:hypothetical protein
VGNLQCDEFSVAVCGFVVVDVVVVEVENSEGILPQIVSSVEEAAIEGPSVEDLGEIGVDLVEDLFFGELLSIFACILLNLLFRLDDARQ